MLHTAYHTVRKTTLFKALYGRDPPWVIKVQKGDTFVYALEDQLLERDAILEDLKGHLLKAQQKMKAMADKNRKKMLILKKENGCSSSCSRIDNNP